MRHASPALASKSNDNRRREYRRNHHTCQHHEPGTIPGHWYLDAWAHRGRPEILLRRISSRPSSHWPNLKPRALGSRVRASQDARTRCPQLSTTMDEMSTKLGPAQRANQHPAPPSSHSPGPCPLSSPPDLVLSFAKLHPICLTALVPVNKPGPQHSPPPGVLLALPPSIHIPRRTDSSHTLQHARLVERCTNTRTLPRFRNYF